MRKIVTVIAAALGLLLPVGPAPATPSALQAIGAQLVVGGLDWPAAFTFAPDGRIFYAERFSGEVRIYNPANGSNTLFTTITNLSTSGERGLLGLALHPRYPTIPAVYAYATRFPGDPVNQIIVTRDVGGVGGRQFVIFESETQAGLYHDGGRILFGPDGKLYAIVGDAHNAANAQDLSKTAGKILRMNAAGRAPADNPLPGNLGFAYGIRNSYGFAFDPETGILWETENGPECNDELNPIFRARNYGWGPSADCGSAPPPLDTNRDGPNPVLPASWYTPVVAPVGNAFCDACGLAASDEGTMFYGRYNTREIRRVTLTPNRLGVASETTVLTHARSPLSMEVGPDSAIYFSDDRAIYRLVLT